MSEHDEQNTPAESPQARRLKVTLDLPPDATPNDVIKALANVVFSTNQNLAYLRADAEARQALETVNAHAIRVLSDRFTRLEARVDAIVGRRWGRVLAVQTGRLRLAAATALFVFLSVAAIAIAVVACHR